MNDRKALDKAGFQTGDTHTAAEVRRAAIREQLQSTLPSLVNGDGLLDANALRDTVGIEGFSPPTQGYGLNFAGKGLARIKADEPTTKELRVDLEQSKHFDETANIIIRGDNLDALKILQQSYVGAVKMIYIDPPYNTPNANFVYKDGFKETEGKLIEKYGLDEEAIQFFENMVGTLTHSGWLFAMYPRLRVARELLADDGLLFVSIDDNEQANLKILCDESFGTENFVAALPTVMNLKGNQDQFAFAGTHEYTLVYAKNAEVATIAQFPIDEDAMDSWEQDERGYFKKGASLKGTGVNAPRSARPDLFFPIFVTPQGACYVTADNLPRDKADLEVLPITRGSEVSWRWSKKKIQQDGGDIIVESSNGSVAFYKKQRAALGDLPSKKPKSLFYRPEYSSGNGTERVKALFGDRVFDNPKPVALVKDFVRLATPEGGLVLDFFAGSGTTAEAVMQLNHQDGGKRRFILVQADEVIGKKTSTGQAAVDFCEANGLVPLISSLCIERANRAGKEIRQGGFLDNGLDVGYKVFSLADKPDVTEGDDGQIALVSSRQSALDVLYSMMAASGEVLLTDPIVPEEVDKVYKVGASYFVLDKCEMDLRELSDSRVYINGYAEFSLLDWLNALGLDKELVKILY